MQSKKSQKEETGEVMPITPFIPKRKAPVKKGKPKTKRSGS